MLLFPTTSITKPQREKYQIIKEHKTIEKEKPKNTEKSKSPHVGVKAMVIDKIIPLTKSEHS